MMGKLKIGTKKLCNQFPQQFACLLKYLKCKEVTIGLKTCDEICCRILSVKDKYVIVQEPEGQVRFIDLCCICYVCIGDICNLVDDLFGCDRDYK